MKKKFRINTLLLFLILTAFTKIFAQQHVCGAELEKLLGKPSCLEGYQPNQSGPLHRMNAREGEKDDSTFSVEKIIIASDSVMIHGWLYLPLGEGKFPLMVMTNGGGSDPRRIKSLSNWMAPIFAHCGIATFVHDKRGTGESGGDFAKTTYNDYIRDAGNCAAFLSKHQKINSDKVGVMGGSEGGRIAVLAASRYAEIKFVISFAGTVVNTVEDRIYAQTGSFKARGIPDSTINAIIPLWRRSLEAWKSNDLEEHEKVNKEIREWRKKFDPEILPATKQEMDSNPDFREVLSTWYSIQYDYLSELAHFNKKWLAVFGEADQVVPTEASVKNIEYYMTLSGNKNYATAVIPNVGHSPVNVETNRVVRIDNLSINWLNENILK